MFISKRGGRIEIFDEDKIRRFLSRLSENLKVEVEELVTKIASRFNDGQTSLELGNYMAEICASLCAKHPDYNILAGRIEILNLRKETPDDFFEFLHKAFEEELITKEIYEIGKEARETISETINQSRDLEFDFFSVRTLKRSYLLRSRERKILERPQFLFMRVSLSIHKNDIASMIETYDLMSRKFFIHASPTLFFAGSPSCQLSSCFVLTVKDSIEGVFSSLTDTARISKYAGGVGISVSGIRSKGAPIHSINGYSSGLVPILKMFDSTSAFVVQGGKRPAAFAVYLEPWHADVEKFIELKRPTGPEEFRTRKLFGALWVSDLFMKRVKEGKKWTLMCPLKCPNLDTTWGKEHEALYEEYERRGMGSRKIAARELWERILASQIQTGTPYILFKDAANAKSNQQNLGTIRGSNLCAEIIEYHDENEIAICNLASINLKAFVTPDKSYDFAGLKKVSAVVTKNLNRVIDGNNYFIERSRDSNFRHRPLGIGVQGLADTYASLKIPFNSEEARKLNREIFETIYFGALEQSCELSRIQDPYETYRDSPLSKGLFQFDLWGAKVDDSRHNWSELREKISRYGVRNSLLLALMPTASTAQILGNNESFEPFMSNLFTRRVTSGEFQIINKFLVKELEDLRLWSEEMRDLIVKNHGSVQNLQQIPEEVRRRYPTVWEIGNEEIILQAKERGIFVDQSQSMNLFFETPNKQRLKDALFLAWESGLKTGLYYARWRNVYSAIQFSLGCSSCS